MARSDQPRRRQVIAAAVVSALVVSGGVALAVDRGSSIADQEAADLANQALDEAGLAAPDDTIGGDAISRPDLFLPARPDSPDAAVTTLAVIQFLDGTAGEVTVWAEPDKAVGELTLGPDAFCIGLPSGAVPCYSGFDSPDEPLAIGGSDGDHGTTIVALPSGTTVLQVQTSDGAIEYPALEVPTDIATGAIAVIADDDVDGSTGPVPLVAVDDTGRELARNDDGLPRR